MAGESDREKMITALCNKGFTEDRIGKDKILFLMDENGKKTPVSTAFQSGGHGKIVSKVLFGKIARELHMNSMELDECVKCDHDHAWILMKARNDSYGIKMQNPTRHRPPIGLK